MALKLKDQIVLDHWETILEHGAGHAGAFFRDVQERLHESELPDCTTRLEEVKSSTFLPRVRRDFLVVRYEPFLAHTIFIGARDFGAHLDCCRLLTVEPEAFPDSEGQPPSRLGARDILAHQDILAWRAVVHRCVVQAAQALAEELGESPARVPEESLGFLKVW